MASELHLVTTLGPGSTAASKPRFTFVRGPIVSSAEAINNEATPSVAYAYLSAYIKHHGYETTLVDGIGEALGTYWPLPDVPGYICQGLGFDEIVTRIPADTKYIGVSAMFSGEWPVTRELIRRIRKAFPDRIIIAGGEHITALTEYSLRDCREIDYCVRGEGEHPLFELLETLEEKADPRRVASVAFIDSDGSYVSTGKVTRIRPVGQMPWPHWPEGYLEKYWDAGKSYGVSSGRDMPFMVSRGCPYQCTFCSNPQMWSNRYFLRDVEDAIKEIKHYIERYQITGLQFYDLTAITVKKWTVDFCNALIRENINVKWSLPSGTRSEALDEETLTLLKKTGCNYLVYAPESGSQRTVEMIKKRIKLPEFTKSVLAAKRIGLVLRTNLIIGFPHEKRSDIFNTVRYGLKLALHGVDEVSINIFSPYPGSELFSQLSAQGKVQLSDRYFFALTSLNSDYTKLNPMTVNENIGARELAFYRISFMLSNYLLGYIVYPSRILRTVRNIFFNRGEAATVLEHRLQDRMRRRMLTATPDATPSAVEKQPAS